jgi:hypothetical protein
MGYRSDVTCIMYTNDPKDKGAGAIMSAWLKHHIHDDDIQYFEFHDTEVIFLAEDWKWYESYLPIQRLMNLFTEFDQALCGGADGDGSCCLEFMRVGESYDDVEQHDSNNSHGRLSLSRCIRIEGIDD